MLNKIVLVASLFFISFAFAQNEPSTMTASWDAPTLRENGDAFLASEVDHYTLYFVNNLGETEEVVTPAGITSFQREVAPGAYSVAVSVTDKNGLTSKLSETLTFSVYPSDAPVNLPVPDYKSIPGMPSVFKSFECSSNIKCIFE
jgi:hypothetical protein